MNKQIENVRTTKQGEFLNDIIFSTFDASDVKSWLESQGYTVKKNYAGSRSGWAITICGIKVSTNGYCCKE